MAAENKTTQQLVDEIKHLRERIEQLEGQAIQRRLQQLQQNTPSQFNPDHITLTETLRTIGLKLASTLNYDEVLDGILSYVNQLVSVDAVNLMLVEGEIARVFRWRGYAWFGEQESLSTETVNINALSTLRLMAETHEPLLIANVADYPDWVRQPQSEWIQSYIGVPIHYHGQLLAFLNLNSATPNFFTPTDATYLKLFAEHAALGLRNANLYNQARQETINRIRALISERNFITGILDTADALVITLTPRGRIVRLNRATEETAGYSIDEVRGKQFWEVFMVSNEMAMVKDRLLALQSSDEALQNYEGHLVTKSGEQRIIAWSNTAIQDNTEKVKYIISTGIDITDRKKVEEALRRSEERYALAALSTNDGLWDWNLDTNRVYFSPRWKAILGYEEAEIGRDPEAWFSRVHPEDRAQLTQSLEKHISGEAEKFENQHRLLHKDGEYRWILSRGIVIRDQKGHPYRMTGSHTDITQRKLAEEKLFHNAFHDALTDLPNRMYFMERLQQAITVARQNEDYQYAVLFLDLDRFKVINDSLGHLVGDELLIAVADRLRQLLRAGDLVARLGGDEFAILLDNIHDESQATLVAERIQHHLGRAFDLNGHEVFTGASIGIALSSTGYERPDEVLRDADTTMYKAKALGRSRHATFEAGMRAQAVAVWRLEAELRRAIERHEFYLEYQPIISTADYRLIGVEALLRWHHPERGRVAPNEFIMLAEETGLILSLGEWIIEEACRQTQRWRDLGGNLWVSVNISPKQGRHENLATQIEAILKRTQLPPSALKLEISENFTNDDSDSSLRSFDYLSQMGVRIALDDFGIGSPLSFLKGFPINTLKIDRSFVRNIVTDNAEAAIIQAMITMAHTLKLEVIAEGVETEGQLTLLKDYHCDFIQGHVFSPSLPADRITSLHRKNPDVIIPPDSPLSINSTTPANTANT